MPHISSHHCACVSHYGAQRTTSHHGRALAQHREGARGVPCGFTQTFRRARLTDAHAARVAPSPRAPSDNASDASTSTHRVWPAAFALLLVSNLAAPAAAGLPRRNLIDDFHDNDLSLPGQPPAAPNAPPQAEALNASTAASTAAPDNVDIRPVERTYFKRDYTLMELLKAVAMSNAPFERFGDSLSDAYAVLNEQMPSPVTRDDIRRGARVADTATGLLPKVRLLRLPGDIAQLAVYELEGKPIELRDVLKLMDYLAPKTENGRGETPLDAQNVSDASTDTVPPALFIEGEREYLTGYTHDISSDKLPPDSPRRFSAIDGRHHIAGLNGDYRVTRDQRDDDSIAHAPFVVSNGGVPSLNDSLDDALDDLDDVL